MADRGHTPGEQKANGYPYGLAREEIPIAVIRQAFHESGMTIAALARQLRLHKSGVGRVVRGHKAHQYKTNADGELIDYPLRQISMKSETARHYIRAMGLDPRDYGVPV